MLFHHDPRPSGGDPHRLVVVPVAAAGCEGVSEPEPPPGADAVGHIRQRRRSLVRGDDQVRIIAVPATHPRRADHLAADDIVSDVEQPFDEQLVAGSHLRGGLLRPVRRVQPPAHEPALGPGGHDDGVLQHLRVDEPEDLGAQVVVALAPSDPPAGDRAAPQVESLQSGRIDERLDVRPGSRQLGNGSGVELQGEGPPGSPRSRPVVGTQRGVDQAQVAAQDLVLVQPLDGGQGVQHMLAGGRHFLVVALATGPEPGVEVSQHGLGGLRERHEGVIELLVGPG